MWDSDVRWRYNKTHIKGLELAFWLCKNVINISHSGHTPPRSMIFTHVFPSSRCVWEAWNRLFDLRAWCSLFLGKKGVTKTSVKRQTHTHAHTHTLKPESHRDVLGDVDHMPCVWSPRKGSCEQSDLPCCGLTSPLYHTRTHEDTCWPAGLAFNEVYVFSLVPPSKEVK